MKGFVVTLVRRVPGHLSSCEASPIHQILGSTVGLYRSIGEFDAVHLTQSNALPHHDVPHQTYGQLMRQYDCRQRYLVAAPNIGHTPAKPLAPTITEIGGNYIVYVEYKLSVPILQPCPIDALLMAVRFLTTNLPVDIVAVPLLSLGNADIAFIYAGANLSQLVGLVRDTRRCRLFDFLEYARHPLISEYVPTSADSCGVAEWVERVRQANGERLEAGHLFTGSWSIAARPWSGSASHTGDDDDLQARFRLNCYPGHESSVAATLAPFAPQGGIVWTQGRYDVELPVSSTRVAFNVLQRLEELDAQWMSNGQAFPVISSSIVLGTPLGAEDWQLGQRFPPQRHLLDLPDITKALGYIDCLEDAKVMHSHIACHLRQVLSTYGQLTEYMHLEYSLFDTIAFVEELVDTLRQAAEVRSKQSSADFASTIERIEDANRHLAGCIASRLQGNLLLPGKPTSSEFEASACKIIMAIAGLAGLVNEKLSPYVGEPVARLIVFGNSCEVRVDRLLSRLSLLRVPMTDAFQLPRLLLPLVHDMCHGGFGGNVFLDVGLGGSTYGLNREQVADVIWLAIRREVVALWKESFLPQDVAQREKHRERCEQPGEMLVSILDGHREELVGKWDDSNCWYDFAAQVRFKFSSHSDLVGRFLQFAYDAVVGGICPERPVSIERLGEAAHRVVGMWGDVCADLQACLLFGKSAFQGLVVMDIANCDCNSEDAGRLLYTLWLMADREDGGEPPALDPWLLTEGAQLCSGRPADFCEEVRMSCLAIDDRFSHFGELWRDGLRSSILALDITSSAMADLAALSLADDNESSDVMVVLRLWARFLSGICFVAPGTQLK